MLQKYRKWWIFGLSVAVLAGFFVLRTLDPNLYLAVIAEDSWAEYFQFFSYLTAGFVLVASAHRARTGQRVVRVALALCGIALMLVAAEEISWGQRILGIDTPESYQQINFQNELTLHNLDAVQGYLHYAYMVIGLAGGLGWLLARALRRVAWVERLRPWLPKWYLMGYFLPVFGFYFAHDYLRPYIYDQFEVYVLDPVNQEVFETLLSLGFIWWAQDMRRRLRDIGWLPARPAKRESAQI